MENIDLRDYLAGQVMCGFMASMEDGYNTSIPKSYMVETASFSYKMADAMLIAREATQNKRQPYQVSSTEDVI